MSRHPATPVVANVIEAFLGLLLRAEESTACGMSLWLLNCIRGTKAFATALGML